MLKLRLLFRRLKYLLLFQVILPLIIGASVSWAAIYPDKPPDADFFVDGSGLIEPDEKKQINLLASKLLKEEWLGRMIFFGERSLHRAIREYAEHYHVERPHRGIGNRVIEQGRDGPISGTEIRCIERLGGLLKHYRRAA